MWLENVARAEAEKMQKELERERLRKEIFIEESKKAKKKKFRQLLEKKLQKNLCLITETNLIAKELQREVEMSLVFSYSLDLTLKKPLINVQVINEEEKAVYHWSLSKFHNRYYFIKEMFDKYILKSFL